MLKLRLTRPTAPEIDVCRVMDSHAQVPVTINDQKQLYQQHQGACCGAPSCNFQHQNWQHDPYVIHSNSDLPPISNLLIREAEAWRAVLSLHTTTMNASYQLTHVPDNQQGSLTLEEERDMNSESRETTYCSALTNLASQCDSLVSEVMRLRTLRKTRRSLEVQCVKEIVRSHSDEILAIGQTLASNSALNVASSATELRIAIQKQRNQVSQLRMLLEAVRNASTLPLPKNGKLMVSVAVDGSVCATYDIESVMSCVYKESRELNETSLTMALSKLMMMNAPDTSPQSSIIQESAPDKNVFASSESNGKLDVDVNGGQKRFVRRAADRTVEMNDHIGAATTPLQKHEE